MGSHCSKGKRIPVVFDDVYILFVLFPIFVLIVAVAIAVAIDLNFPVAFSFHLPLTIDVSVQDRYGLLQPFIVILEDALAFAESIRLVYMFQFASVTELAHVAWQTAFARDDLTYFAR